MGRETITQPTHLILLRSIVPEYRRQERNEMPDVGIAVLDEVADRRLDNLELHNPVCPRKTTRERGGRTGSFRATPAGTAATATAAMGKLKLIPRISAPGSCALAAQHSTSKTDVNMNCNCHDKCDKRSQSKFLRSKINKKTSPKARAVKAGRTTKLYT